MATKAGMVEGVGYESDAAQASDCLQAKGWVACIV